MKIGFRSLMSGGASEYFFDEGLLVGELALVCWVKERDICMKTKKEKLCRHHIDRAYFL